MSSIVESILSDSDGLIVLNKPRNMPTAGDHLEQEGSAQYALMQWSRRRKIWAVHQLDKLTTGLNLFVRRKALVQTWTARLAEGNKHYLAICQGRVPHDHFYIKDPLGWRPDLRRHGVVDGGKPAKTEVFVLGRSDTHSFIHVILHTGRTHQVRAHLSHRGHPLLGDPLYHPLGPHHDGLALHAWRVRWADGEQLEAPLDEMWQAWLGERGWSADVLGG